MKSKSFVKIFTYMFAISVFAVLSGFVGTIISWFQPQGFTGINILDLLLLAEGIVFWRAIKSTSIEKTLQHFDALKPFSFILAAYSVYRLVTQIMALFSPGGYQYGTIENISFIFLRNFSALFSSLNIFITTVMLRKNELKKMNKSFVYLLSVEMLLIVGSLGCLVFLSDTISTIITYVLLFILALAVLPALLANSVLKGALIGYIIAGDTGAVIGAVAAKEKDKK